MLSQVANTDRMEHVCPAIPILGSQCFIVLHLLIWVPQIPTQCSVPMFHWTRFSSLASELHQVVRRKTRRLQGTSSVFRPLTQFESLLKSAGPKQLSRAYCSIIRSLTKVEDRVRKKWETAIHKNVLDLDWEFFRCFGQKFLFNVAIRDNRSKILHQWNLTPARLTKMFSGASDTCPRCGRGVNFLLI